ncbi:hypothetical protein BDP27DRAFT_652001 [Rhodocollybia butyracea]|uniref:Uncharacterized protein n=1 Tax=Rhodocollybia butyracea TaxID=206335 RepID=A0A9P5PXJ6_9AGAR|nr:hypothetical protein BDP27DRAFT_652001 [Rhodocollybia butyracea]
MTLKISSMVAAPSTSEFKTAIPIVKGPKKNTTMTIPKTLTKNFKTVCVQQGQGYSPFPLRRASSYNNTGFK